MGTRRRLGLLALLGCAAALVLLAAQQRRVERRARADPAPPAAPAAAADVAAGSGGVPGAGERAPPARDTSTEDLTATLVAECRKERIDAERIEPLVRQLEERSEEEILGAAAALLACGTKKGVELGWSLVMGVLDRERRKLTDDAVYAIVGDEATTIFETSDDRATYGRKWLAGNILARVGTADAIETLLRMLAREDPGAFEAIGGATNPASAPLLSRALVSCNPFHTGYIAAALGSTTEGRAELRRILDPAAGFDWTRDGAAKVSAFTTLVGTFREAADLVALDAALREHPGLAKYLEQGWNDAYVPPTKSAQARAIVEFLPGHLGSPLEDTLLALLGSFPERIVDPLLPKLDAAQRERVAAARKPSK